MEPIPFLALDDEFCRIGKICCPRSVISRLRDYVDHQVPGSRLTYLCQRASDRLLCFVRGCENQAPLRRLQRPAGQRRLGSTRDHAPRRCSSSLEQWLALRRGRRAWETNRRLAAFSAPRSCKSAPRMIEARTGPFLVLRFTMPARAACRVISKEIEHRPVITCRRREIQGPARQGRSGVIGVTKFADILKTPVEKYVVCRHQAADSARTAVGPNSD